MDVKLAEKHVIDEDVKTRVSQGWRQCVNQHIQYILHHPLHGSINGGSMLGSKWRGRCVVSDSDGIGSGSHGSMDGNCQGGVCEPVIIRRVSRDWACRRRETDGKAEKNGVAAANDDGDVVGGRPGAVRRGAGRRHFVVVSIVRSACHVTSVNSTETVK